jgi:hypothetical protein
VFKLKLKLDEILNDMMYKQVMGNLARLSMIIEYLKRMLPHAHIVVIIHPDNRHKTAEDIDNFLVSAEIPREPTDDDNEEKREYLIRFRTADVAHIAHGLCGAENPSEFLAKAVKGVS